MSKHTDGPWYVECSGSAEDYDEPLLNISPEEHSESGSLFRAKIVMFPRRKTKLGGTKHLALATECEDIARLMAAAPDLLRELKEAREGLRWYYAVYSDSVAECDYEAMERIEAVIAKAEGREA